MLNYIENRFRSNPLAHYELNQIKEQLKQLQDTQATMQREVEHNGVAKVGPAGARSLAVQTCDPAAVPRQLPGRRELRQQQPVDSKKS